MSGKWEPVRPGKGQTGKGKGSSVDIRQQCDCWFALLLR